MLRRSLTLPLALIALTAATAGCTTFSDSDVVARVDDVELTRDDFDARLVELGVTDADVVPLDPVRAEITTWIQAQLIAENEIADPYNAGPAESGITCVRAIVVNDQELADTAVADIEAGTPFAEVFERDNLDASLSANGGAIPCITAADLEASADIPFIGVVAELNAADPIGSAPIIGQAGDEVAWVVLSFRPFDDLDPEQVDQIAGLADITAAAADADIFVDSRYGTFDAASGEVVSLG